MLPMLDIEDIVSVGWQWASHTPMCHGKGSVASFCARSSDEAGPLAGWSPVGGHMSGLLSVSLVVDDV